MQNAHGGTLYARQCIDANLNLHTLSLMWHVSPESERTWGAFDAFIHESIPHLKSLCVSIIM